MEHKEKWWILFNLNKIKQINKHGWESVEAMMVNHTNSVNVCSSEKTMWTHVDT